MRSIFQFVISWLFGTWCSAAPRSLHLSKAAQPYGHCYVKKNYPGYKANLVLIIQL
jgi:hypothetical protein